jgi:hypothetical protein
MKIDRIDDVLSLKYDKRLLVAVSGNDQYLPAKLGKVAIKRFFYPKQIKKDRIHENKKFTITNDFREKYERRLKLSNQLKKLVNQ